MEKVISISISISISIYLSIYLSLSPSIYIYIYIFTPNFMCSQQLSFLYWMKNSLMSLIYFPQCLFFSKIIHLQKGYSISNRPKFQRLGLDSSQILMTLFQMKGIYKIKLPWKFQYKLITCSKITIPQSVHGKLKIDKTSRVKQLGCILRLNNFFVLNPKFWNLLHCFCTQQTLR